jgi:hypothetical protein
MTGWTFGWWWGGNTPKVTVVMPVLKQLILTGATDGTVSGFKSDNPFSLKVSGASHIDVDMDTGIFNAIITGASDVKGRLNTTGSDVEVSGASDINLTGNGGDIKLKGSGASTASLRYFAVNDADVTLSGASSGSVTPSGRLDVNVSGASDLNYYGNPSMGNIQTSGASDLHHKTN